MAYGQKYQKGSKAYGKQNQNQTQYQNQYQAQSSQVNAPVHVDPTLAVKRLTYGFMVNIAERAKAAQPDELKQYVEMYCMLADRMNSK